jgi:hypothetical protein
MLLGKAGAHEGRQRMTELVVEVAGTGKEAVTAAQRAADEIMRPYVEHTALKVLATN